MRGEHDPKNLREHTLLLLLFVLFLFASPFTVWWASEESSWLLPYLLWLWVILLGAWLRVLYRHHDL